MKRMVNRRTKYSVLSARYPVLSARHPVPSTRRAHSLIEMLVVVLIAGVLMAIAVPAIQRSRASARQAQCISHQADLAKAVHMFVARDGYFPGFRYQEAGGTDAIGWAAQLFSFLGRNDLDPAQAVYIETLVCPADPGPRDRPRMNYVANGGQAGVDSVADGIFFDHAKPLAERVYITRDDFVDGLSNTILIAENLDATEWNVTDEENQCILWPLTAGNEVNAGSGPRPSSHHPGGFVTAFADGTVRFMAEREINDDTNVHTDQSIYVALLTPGGSDLPTTGGGSNEPPPDCDDNGYCLPPELPSGYVAGLKGEWHQGAGTGGPGGYEAPDPNSPVITTRIDPNLAHPFGNNRSGLLGPWPGKPEPFVGPFSIPAEGTHLVVYSGQLWIPVDGPITFFAEHDDVTMLWIDGEHLMDNWIPPGHIWGHYEVGQINVSAGRWVDILVYSGNVGGPNFFSLQWSYTGQAQQVIPDEFFRTQP